MCKQISCHFTYNTRFICFKCVCFNTINLGKALHKDPIVLETEVSQKQRKGGEVDKSQKRFTMQKANTRRNDETDVTAFQIDARINSYSSTWLIHMISLAPSGTNVYKSGGEIISLKEIISLISIAVIIHINYIINLDCLSYVKYNILTCISNIYKYFYLDTKYHKNQRINKNEFIMFFFYNVGTPT